jgi:hypothetical protein
MDPRFKASLLWGLVGGMAFLTLAQGYNLLADEFLGVGPMAAGALGVLVVTVAVVHTLRPRLPGNESP